MAMPVLAAGHTQWHLNRVQRIQGYAVTMPAMLAGHYHWHLHKIQRSQGHSITAAAAYITGGDVRDARAKKRHDYTERFGVIETDIRLPLAAPRDFLDLSVLCNAAEAAEPRLKAVVGRSIDFGLPHQLSPRGDRRAGLRMAQALVDRYGTACITAWHKPSHLEGHDQRNRHCHIIMTSRRIGPEGFGEKTRELDDLLQGPAEIEWMRREWMRIANEELANEGINVRISCFSLKDQGITDLLPQIHEGVAVRAMLDRGVDPALIQKLHGRPASTEANDNRLKKRIPYEDLDQGRNRVQFNGQIRDANEWVDAQGPGSLQEQIAHCEHLIEYLAEKITDLQSFLPLAVLPHWLRVKVERYRIMLMAAWERFVREEEAEEKRRYREGIHARMRELLEIKKRIEEQKRQKEVLQRFYMRIEHQIITRPPVHIAPVMRAATRVLTNKQFAVELHFKAETARAKVPPEYRPRIERPATSWQGAIGSLTPRERFAAAVKGPPDNGGLARRPPALKANFNAQADPVSEPAYRKQVKIAFGPKTG